MQQVDSKLTCALKYQFLGGAKLISVQQFGSGQKQITSYQLKFVFNAC